LRVGTATAGRADFNVERRDAKPGKKTKAMPAKYAPTAPPSRTIPATIPGPVKTLRLGRIKAAIWENSAKQGTFYNVTFARSYMSEDKKWHDADSFGRDDLLLLSKLADQAHTFVCERLAAQRAEE
jgi:hypothetical protein